jgi:hypothetical protein
MHRVTSLSLQPAGEASRRYAFAPMRSPVLFQRCYVVLCIYLPLVRRILVFARPFFFAAGLLLLPTSWSGGFGQSQAGRFHAQAARVLAATCRSAFRYHPISKAAVLNLGTPFLIPKGDRSYQRA